MFWSCAVCYQGLSCCKVIAIFLVVRPHYLIVLSLSLLQMDPVLSRFLDKFPTAAATAAAAVDEVTRVAAPLGLQKRRPVAIIRFSRETGLAGQGPALNT